MPKHKILTKEHVAEARKFIFCFGITVIREDQLSPPPLRNVMQKFKISFLASASLA
jgi:hypothetical protein